MRFLRQNTAVRVTVGPFYDKTDGVTPETALTVTNCKLTLMVDDGNVPTLVLDAAATASAGNNDMVHVTNDDAGFYDLELTAAQTNYVGRAMLAITDAANHCPVFHEFMILPANVYDSFVLGTDNLQVDTTQVGGTAQTARDLGASVLLSSGTGTGQVSLSSGAVALQADQAVNAAKIGGTTQTGRDLGASVLLSVGTGTGQVNLSSGKVPATLAAADVTGNVAADVVAISGDSVAADNLEAACDGTTYNIGGGAVVAASVTGAVGSVTGAVGSVTGAVGSVTGNVGGNVAGSVASVTGNVGGNVVGSVGSVTAAVTAGTVSDKTGYALTSAYDPAKTAAQAGDEMDLVDAPNGTAVTAIQSGLAVPGDEMMLTAAYDAAKTAASASDVATEVADALGTDAMAELAQGQPPATPTVKQALMLLYMALRNELTTDASSKKIRNDAGTVIAKKALSDDTTTYTEEKMVTGP